MGGGANGPGGGAADPAPGGGPLPSLVWSPEPRAGAGALWRAALRLAGGDAVGAAATEVATGPQFPGLLWGALGVVAPPGWLSEAGAGGPALPKVAKNLVPGGLLHLHLGPAAGGDARWVPSGALRRPRSPQPPRPPPPATDAARVPPKPRSAEARRRLLVAGLVDAEELPAGAEGGPVFAARKPRYEKGAKAALSFGLKKKPKVAKPSGANVWSLLGAAGDDDGEELIDEGALLAPEDRLQAPIQYDDCEVGKGGRKACKNCTCGRADMEGNMLDAADGDAAAAAAEPPAGGCGSCALGDAYRCASCPHRGQPAFEAGEKVKLDAQFLDADMAL